MLPCEKNDTSFFEKLQNCQGLDLRDNRGKRHELAIILLGVTLAVLSNRDGKMSSIHRHLQFHHAKLLDFLGLELQDCISRSHLPIVLGKVSVTALDDLILKNYGIRLSEKQKKWFAVDGKELRGSIESGAKRGEAVVQAVGHERGEVQSQNYYNGRKASEVGTVRQLLEESDLLGQKISLDALHCKPKTLEMIAKEKGIYLIGLKRNQKELFHQMGEASQALAVKYATENQEQERGRITTRIYQVYDITRVKTATRWAKSKLARLVKVSRKTIERKTGKETEETSYYVSNEKGKEKQLSQAVRGHWQVEVNNHIRDVTLAEDDLRTKKKK
jgi:predicted transposase YbfD/YdcC